MRAVVALHCLLAGFVHGADVGQCQTNSVEGWTVLVDERLLAEQSVETKKALELLRTHLKEIVRVVPASPMEYFAENTEAFFSRNDCFPFARAELKRHDPEMEELAKVWSVTK
ncbi:MAG: hypothetical protein FJ403_06265 [Verrucomicrobia bacterium]|nr:hypothetical protein [Verrucomicrobiota bacterium]